MSFILDALRKSETERQQQQSTEFASVAVARRSSSGPRWVWIIGILLAINSVVLLGLYWRQDAEPPRTDIAPRIAASTFRTDTEAAVSEPTFTERVATAKAVGESVVAIEASAPKAVAERPRATLSSGVYPTIHTVRANGAIVLPDLHLDIHVYSDEPKDRFVFINMSKHREGSQLDEGPVVFEITTDGVVLGHRGLFFLLPRD